MIGEDKLRQSQEILEKAAKQISDLGIDNRTVSEIFFAYGIRIGALVVGERVFEDARVIINGMEKQSRL